MGSEEDEKEGQKLSGRVERFWLADGFCTESDTMGEPTEDDEEMDEEGEG